MGKPELRTDSEEKVTGRAKYTGDLRFPGMLYARILRPPAHGARLTSVDTTGVKAIKGARIIEDGDLIAVLHEDPELAEKGLNLIKAEFDSPKTGTDDNTIFDHLLKIAPPGELVSEAGDLAEGEENAIIVVEKTYLDGYKAHAPIESHTAIAMWDYGVYFAGTRGAEHYYDIPHHRTSAFVSNWGGIPGAHPFATGPWRAPGNNTNVFARESHIDILAEKAGVDPLEFRLGNLKDKRMIRVLETAAKRFGWRPGKAPSGRGYGIATGIDAGTYVAHMAVVEVDMRSGHVQVKRVVCAQDMGLAINPEGAKIQMEGCITMGLGYALTEDIHFKNGEIFDLNFDTYEIPRFSGLPRIETVLIDDREAAPQGGGEPAIICMGGVIANAINDAIGVRLFQLPMTPERIKEAMNNG